MKFKIIKKYYFHHLWISFIIAVLAINLTIGLKENTPYTFERFLMGTLYLPLFILIISAIIHLINLSYKLNQNALISFIFPLFIWLVILGFSICGLINGKNTGISDCILLLILIDPIIYNLLMFKKTVTNNTYK
ncbi:hypothetical protein OAX11_05000 [Flavobacteriaceae bacterium]|nr:hypothetical protein [Flavobacteriaceae bacterium]